LASKVPEACIEDIRSTFIAIDGNGDGKIQENEMKKAFDILEVEY
jgi:Ca2+-binding EF-hand superfamily protein